MSNKTTTADDKVRAEFSADELAEFWESLLDAHGAEGALRVRGASPATLRAARAAYEARTLADRAADFQAKLNAAADRVAARAAVEDAARRMGAAFTDIGIDITTGDLEQLTLDRRTLDAAITAFLDRCCMPSAS